MKSVAPFRRIWMLLCLVSLISGCGFVNHIRIRNANDNISPQWTSASKIEQLESSYIGEKPYIFASINGRSGFKFLVDTGASFTILFDTPKVNALNLIKGYELALYGWGDDGESRGYQTQAEKFAIGNIQIAEMNFAYLPITTSRYFLRADEAVYDGVIGHDILKHFNWSFDRSLNRIEVMKEAYQPNDDDIRLPFDVSFSKLKVDGEMTFSSGQRLTHPLIIDTGSRHYLKLNANYIRDQEIRLPETTVQAADFGLSGRALHQRINLQQLKLGELTFNQVKTNIIESDDDDDFFVIGSALLNQFVSVVDYATNSLYLRPLTGHKFQSRFNLLGLELRKIRSGEFVVRFVFPDLPAAHSRIQKGDLIMTINGVPALEISQSQWLELTATPGEYQICVKRDELWCEPFASTHIKGYSSID